MVLIVDSGSSTTECRIIDGENISQFKCIGLNPYIVEKSISPIRVGTSIGSTSTINPLINISKRNVYVEYNDDVEYWGHWEDNRINKYGVFRILKVDQEGKEENLKMEGKFFRDMKQDGGEVKLLKNGNQNKSPFHMSNVKVEFEKQIGGSNFTPKQDFCLKSGIIIYKKDSIIKCFEVNSTNQLVELPNCFIKDENLKRAISSAREDAKKAIMSAELSLKTIINEAEEGIKGIEKGTINIDENFKNYTDDTDDRIDTLLNPHAISWILSNEYINNNVDPNLGNNLARKMTAYRSMLKNAEKMNNVLVYN